MEHEHDQIPSKASGTMIRIGFSLLAAAATAFFYYQFESRKQEGQEAQLQYRKTIEGIGDSLQSGECHQAWSIYEQSKKIREEMVKKGMYYNVYPHTLQANAIGIAECFAARGEYDTALEIIKNEHSLDPDFLTRSEAIKTQAQKVSQ